MFMVLMVYSGRLEVYTDGGKVKQEERRKRKACMHKLKEAIYSEVIMRKCSFVQPSLSSLVYRPSFAAKEGLAR